MSRKRQFFSPIICQLFGILSRKRQFFLRLFGTLSRKRHFFADLVICVENANFFANYFGKTIFLNTGLGFQELLGDRLVTAPLNDHEQMLPSPNQLRNRQTFSLSLT
jgi:hypothetical protein